MLIRYPRRVTVNNKRLISKHKKSEESMHIYKSHRIIKNYKGKLLLIALAPSSYVLLKVFILKIGMCLQGLMKFNYWLFKILRKLSIQKPLRITKGDNSNSINP